MAQWYVASNITPGDNSGLDMCPNPGDYTDLNDGDKAVVMILNVVTTYTYDASSSLTESLPQVITPNGNPGNGRWILSKLAASGQNGFDVEIGPQPDTLATIGVSGTTFTLTHVADYDFYIDGVVFRKTGNETVEITDVEGMHWIYFDSEGVLQIQAPGGTVDDLILYNCLVASVYWDAANNQALMLFDERHGTSMSPATHYHLHETLGAQFDEGLALSAFDTDGDGTAATHAQFDLGTGTFHDEDNEHTIAADANATIDTFYRLGVGGPWRKLTATANYPVADPQTGTRMDWNDYNGGTWQLAEVTNNQFVLTHYFATNDTLGGGVIGIMGQAEYTNIVQARTGAETELNALLTGELPVEEILPIATVIWKTTNTSSNQVAGAIYSVSGGGDYIDWRSSERTGASASVSDHESLSGLQGGGTGDHYHLTQTQHDTLTDGSDADALHDHDGISENTAARHTQDTDTQIIKGDSYVVVTDTGSDGTVTVRADNNVEMDITDAGMRLGGANSRVNAILDEDNMSSDSATALATQQSIKKYVDDNVGVDTGRNMIINGDFNIWQRGTSHAAIANNAYSTDRILYSKSGAAVHTISRNTDVPTIAESGHKSNYSMLVDCTTADSSLAAGDGAWIRYKMEGYDYTRLAGRTATLSFWVKGTKTGIHSVAFRNSGFDRAWVSEYTINVTDTWEKKTITVDLDETGGTWNYTTSTGLEIMWVLSCGSDYTTSSLDQWISVNDFASTNQVNATDSTANNFRLSQVKFEIGSTATSFVGKLFEQELAQCQRYYEKSYSVHTVPGTIASAGNVIEFATRNVAGASLGTQFRVNKRSAPTMTIYAPDSGNSGYCTCPTDKVSTASHIGESGIGYINVTGGATSDNCKYHWTADAEL